MTTTRTTTRTFDLHVSTITICGRTELAFYVRVYDTGTLHFRNLYCVSFFSAARLIAMAKRFFVQEETGYVSEVMGIARRLTFTVNAKQQRYEFTPGQQYLVIPVPGRCGDPCRVEYTEAGTFVVVDNTPWEYGEQDQDSEPVRSEAGEHVHANNAQRAQMEHYDSAYSGKGPHSSCLAEGDGCGEVVYTLWFHGEPHAIEWHINNDGHTTLTVTYLKDYKLVQPTGKTPRKEYYSER